MIFDEGKSSCPQYVVVDTVNLQTPSSKAREVHGCDLPVEVAPAPLVVSDLTPCHCKCMRNITLEKFMGGCEVSSEGHREGRNV